MFPNSGLVDLTSAKHSTKRRGVFHAEVTANTEDGGDSRYRLKVKYPWLGEETSHWARIIVPMGGGDRGTYFLPEVGDQVLVVFEHGDINRPIVIGSLWSSKQAPPEQNSDGKNNIRVIKSRSGHRLILDDTDGSERVILVNASNKSKIVLDTANKTVTVESSGDIKMSAPTGACRVFGKDVRVTASGDIKVNGSVGFVSTASGKTIVKASGTLKLSAGQTTINMSGPGAPASGGKSASAGGSSGRSALTQVRETAQQAARGGRTAQRRARQVSQQLDRGGGESGGGQSGGGESGGGQSGGSGGSPAARQQAAGQHTPDVAANPPAATVGAAPAATEVTPGEPIEVTARGDNVSTAHTELVEPASGEVLATGPATVADGQVKGTVETKVLKKRTDVDQVSVRVVADGNVTETAPIPVAGRAADGAPSPSDALADPSSGPPPAVASPSLSPTPGPLEAAELGSTETAAATAGAAEARGTADAAAAAPGETAASAAGADAAAATAASTGDTAAATAASTGDADAAAGAAASAAGADGAVAASTGDAGAAAGAVGGDAASAAATGDTRAAAAAAGGDPGDVAGVADGGGEVAGSVSGGAGVSTGGGVDPDIIRAGQAAADGDAAGAAGAVGGTQAGAAVGGDAAGAVGGGTAGAAVTGDAAGVATAEGGASAGAAVKGDAVGVAAGQSPGVAKVAGAGADPATAGAAVSGDAVAQAAAVRGLDADSPQDFADDAVGDAERHAKEESGVADVERTSDKVQGEAHKAKRDAEYVASSETDVSGKASAETGGVRSDVQGAQSDARGAQDRAADPVDGEREIYEQRATLDAQESRAQDAAGAPGREVAGAEAELHKETADARDPEAAARRARQDAVDSARDESVYESRATLEETDMGEGAASGSASVSRADSAKDDPDVEIKRGLKNEIKKKD